MLVETLGGIAPPTKQFLHVFAKEAAGTNTDRTGTGRRRRAASASSFVVHHTQQIRVQSLFCEPTLDIGQVVHTLNRKCSISMSHPPARGPSRLAGSLPSSPGPPGLAPQPLTQTSAKRHRTYFLSVCGSYVHSRSFLVNNKVCELQGSHLNLPLTDQRIAPEFFSSHNKATQNNARA